MKRKQFIASAISLIPSLAFAREIENGKNGSEPFVVRAGQARYGKPMFYQGKHPNNVVIAKTDTGGDFSVFAYSSTEKIGPPLHLHEKQDEIFWVTEGRFRFVVGDQTLELGAGDSIFLPRKIAHTWIQQSEKGALLYAVHPAGSLEEFFIEMDQLKAPPNEEQIKAIHQRHGMQLLGPGLTVAG